MRKSVRLSGVWENENNWAVKWIVAEHFGEIWAEYCRVCGAPADGEWFATVKEYESEVLSKR